MNRYQIAGMIVLVLVVLGFALFGLADPCPHC